MPAAAPAHTATETVTGPALVTALNHLKAENEALAADLAKLKKQVAAAEGTRAPVATAAAPVAPVAPNAPVADRTSQLFESLAQVTARSGHAGSLRRDGDVGLLTLDQSLIFTVGKSGLTTGAREELRRLAVVFLRFPEARLIVQGHSDATGSAESNQVLSLRRAETVRAELLAIGIRPDSVVAVGFGDTRPVAGNDTSVGRARNRRVDLQITMPASSSN
jgi:outer membrane protein OmpA-like peptidoglycan-associated protein